MQNHKKAITITFAYVIEAVPPCHVKMLKVSDSWEKKMQILIFIRCELWVKNNVWDGFHLVICVWGLILGLHPVNERRRYFVPTSLIGWAQT